MKKIFLILAIFSFALFLGCSTKNDQQNGTLHKQKEQLKTPSFLEATQKELLKEHNKQRNAKGLKPLIADSDLCKYAQKHAEIMAKKNVLYHSQISKLQNNETNVVGENVAWGQENAQSVVDAWMWSPMHRWNILGTSYKKVGFGVAKDENGRIYWCTVFTD